MTARVEDPAAAVGRDAAESLADPTLVVATVRTGIAAPVSAPATGRGAVLGEERLLAALARGFIDATRGDPASALLDVAGALLRDPDRRLHRLALAVLERTVQVEPERSWQLLRAEARTAADTLAVAAIARPAAHGVLAEPFRWAELEQLMYSPSPWERRLAPGTVAVLPAAARRAGGPSALAAGDLAARGLGIVRELIGDADPGVQHDLVRALRTVARLDPPAAAAFLQAEAGRAIAEGDGHRAPVLSAAMPRVAPPGAAALAAALAAVPRVPHVPGDPGTSRAAAAARGFRGLGLEVPPAERPVVPRP